MPDLNTAGTFLAEQLRRILKVGGASQPQVSDQVAAIFKLDPDRDPPFNTKRTWSFSFDLVNGAGAAWNCGVTNAFLPSDNRILVVRGWQFQSVAPVGALTGFRHTNAGAALGIPNVVGTYTDQTPFAAPGPSGWLHTAIPLGAGGEAFTTVLLSAANVPVIRVQPVYITAGECVVFHTPAAVAGEITGSIWGDEYLNIQL